MKKYEKPALEVLELIIEQPLLNGSGLVDTYSMGYDEDADVNYSDK